MLCGRCGWCVTVRYDDTASDCLSLIVKFTATAARCMIMKVHRCSSKNTENSCIKFCIKVLGKSRVYSYGCAPGLLLVHREVHGDGGPVHDAAQLVVVQVAAAVVVELGEEAPEDLRALVGELACTRRMV